MADAASANSRSNDSDILDFVRATRVLTRFFHCQPSHAVCIEPNLRPANLQNGNFLRVRQRLGREFGAASLNFGVRETRGGAKCPVFAGVLAPSVRQQTETGLAG